MNTKIETTATDLTEENMTKLRAAWSHTVGDTHNKTLGEYVAHAFNLTQRGLRRCGIPVWESQSAWLANSRGVI